MGKQLRRVLIMASVPCWLVTAALAVWRAVAPTTAYDDGLTVLAAALAITGTLLAGQQANRPVRDPVRTLLDALLATEDPPHSAATDGRPAAPAARDQAA